MTSTLAASNWSGKTVSLSFFTSSYSTTVCKGSVFLKFYDNIQSSMHQIFTQMYLTVSIGQSRIERPTELFIKKFYFRCDGHPIFPHLNLTSNLPTKIPPNRYMAFYDHHPILQNMPGRHANPVVHN